MKKSSVERPMTSLRTFWYDELMGGRVKTVKLSENGSKLGPRVLGLALSRSILDDIRADHDLTILVNFEGVESVSSGFAFDLFGTLRAALGDAFSSKVKLRFTGDESRDREIKAILFRALQAQRAQ